MKSKYVVLLALMSVVKVLYADFGEKKTFNFVDEPIDVVIPAVNRGRSEYCIASIKRFGKSIRNVYVISPEQVTDKAIWIDESIFPFSIFDVAKHLYKDEEKAQEHLKQGKGRIGWYLQQLLKLYAPLVIPDISSNILLLDSDVIFLKPVNFMNEKSEPLFCVSGQHHKRYFEHAQRLIPGFERIKGVSGIAHHMLIQRDVIENLFSLIESIHNKPAWQAFCECVEVKEDGSLPSTGMSEFEIYFNYFFASSDQGHIRKLKWANVAKENPLWDRTITLKELFQFMDEEFVFISRH